MKKVVAFLAIFSFLAIIASCTGPHPVGWFSQGRQTREICPNEKFDEAVAADSSAVKKAPSTEETILRSGDEEKK